MFVLLCDLHIIDTKYRLCHTSKSEKRYSTNVSNNGKFDRLLIYHHDNHFLK